MNYTFAQYEESAAAIRAKLNGFTPKVAMILGSGLGFLGDEVENPITIPYGEIPNFKSSTAPGHKGQLVFGYLEGQPVAVMQGRMHHYEGYEYQEVTFPLRVLRLLGCDTLFVTNAAGCVNTAWNAGEVMLITDQIGFFAHSPLRGENVDEFGTRFPDASYIYTPRLCQMAKNAASQLNLTLREGVYFYAFGPQFETPAEVRAVRVLGGDAVGMSTTPEASVANHCGMEVLGFSLLSNMAAGILDQPLSGEEVNECAEGAKETFTALVRRCLTDLPA